MSDAASVLSVFYTDLYTAVSSMCCSTWLRGCPLFLSHSLSCMALSSVMVASLKSKHKYITNHSNLWLYCFNNLSRVQYKRLPGMRVLLTPPSSFCGALCPVLCGPLLCDLSLFLMFRSLSSRNPEAGCLLRPRVNQVACQDMKRLW